MAEINDKVIHKNGGIYLVMKVLIAVESYEETFVIPEGVEEISDSAFWRCEKLKHVVIPNSVIRIGNSAFAGCSSLQEVIIPDSVTDIGHCAFYMCESLTKIRLPASLKFMEGDAFVNCMSIKEIICENDSFMVDDIIHKVERANEQLCLGISDAGFLIPLVIDFIFRICNISTPRYRGFFNLSNGYEFKEYDHNIYY